MYLDEYDIKMIAAIVIIVLLFVSLFGYVGYAVTKRDIQMYYSLCDTIENARDNSDIIERAALTQKIADMNMWIKSVQYWNGTIFGIFTPNEVENLKPII